jgi:hypothetical protein
MVRETFTPNAVRRHSANYSRTMKKNDTLPEDDPEHNQTRGPNFKDAK